ncbi:MAG: DUF2771 domain-containing protein [Mycobacteriaceae bacterium]|nr:DUF2771 domain-containing protein [Mycobacteriaceae bacterium]
MIRSRKALLACAAVLAVAGVVAAAVFIARDRRGTPAPPELTASAQGRSITVAPLKYCSLELTDCADGATAELAVPPEHPLRLTLPAAVTDAPWRLIAVYRGADGKPVPEEHTYPKGGGAEITVRSTATPPLPLSGVEIQIPSRVVDRDGIPYARGIWSIKTS